MRQTSQTMLTYDFVSLARQLLFPRQQQHPHPRTHRRWFLHLSNPASPDLVRGLRCPQPLLLRRVQPRSEPPPGRPVDSRRRKRLSATSSSLHEGSNEDLVDPQESNYISSMLNAVFPTLNNTLIYVLIKSIRWKLRI